MFYGALVTFLGVMVSLSLHDVWTVVVGGTLVGLGATAIASGNRVRRGDELSRIGVFGSAVVGFLGGLILMVSLPLAISLIIGIGAIIVIIAQARPEVVAWFDAK